MTKRQERKTATLERIGTFLTDHPLTPPNPRATVLSGRIATVLTSIRAHGGDQQLGFGSFLSGAAHRRLLAGELRVTLRELFETARALDPVEFPGLGAQFRLPRTRTYQRLLDTARAFHAAVLPIKQAFVDRAFPADFDEALAELIEEFNEASERKNSGRQNQRTGTTGLALAYAEIDGTVRELDVIVTKHLKMNNPILVPTWKNALRIERSPRTEEDEETPETPVAVS